MEHRGGRARGDGAQADAEPGGAGCASEGERRLVRAMRRGASRGRFGPPGNLRAPRVMPQAVPEARVRRRPGEVREA